MNKIYKLYCKAEEFVVGVGFAAIVTLTFMNAVLRVFNAPIIYADDICMLLFSWVALMGADVSMRYCRLVGMDILTSKLPQRAQKILQIIVNIIMIVMLVVLIKGGIKIVNLNGSRPFNTLEAFGIRYAAVTTSIPVCCAMMILTCVIKIFKLFMHFNEDEFTLKKDAADDRLGEENAGVGETPVDLDDAKEATK